MTQFSYQRLDDGLSWGVKASGNLDQATRYAHQTVQVAKRNGSVREVRLGAMLTRWNGGRAAVYEIAGGRPVVRWTAPAAATEQDDDDCEAQYDDMAAQAYLTRYHIGD